MNGGAIILWLGGVANLLVWACFGGTICLVAGVAYLAAAIVLAGFAS